MSYRFVSVANFYRSYLDNYYLRNPDVSNFSYDEQIEAVIAEGFGGMAFLRANLRKIGVDAYGIVANGKILQQTWAREHGVKKTGKAILLEQLKHLRPGVVLFESCAEHNGAFIAQVKNEIPSVKLVIGSRSAPYTMDLVGKLKTFDFMITCAQGLQIDFQRHGLRAYRINHAFESSLLAQIQSANTYPEVDSIFFGSIVSGEGYHNMRKEILERLLEKDVGLHVYCALPEKSSVRILAKQGVYSVTRLLKSLGLEHRASRIPGINTALQWNSFPKGNRLPKRIRNSLRPPLFGMEMLKALSKAKIGLNIHIDIAGIYAANIRLFEVTGVGSCLLTDHKENISEFFDPDREIVTYTSIEDCVEKMQWLLDHPKASKEIAKAGQQRTLTWYTFEHRARQFDEIIHKEMSRI